MFRILRCCRIRFDLVDTVIKDNIYQTIKYQNNRPKILVNGVFNQTFSNSAITHSTPEDNASEPNISEIVGDDAEMEHKLRVLILETEVFRQEGKGVPNNSSLKNNHWKELLRLPSKSSRRKYLEFLFKIEKKKENVKKKAEKRLEREQNPKPIKDSSNILNYNLGGNNFMLRVYDTTMNQLYNNRLIQAMKFGQKLIIDCGFHSNMTRRENINCSKQLMLLFAENRSSDDPFDLHLCNIDRESGLIQGFHKYIVTMNEPWFPLNLHEKSYLEIFPKEKLVYLTPHCQEVLKDYSHDDIYIVGGIVDKMTQEPLSLAKAKKEGLRMAKLPLDFYLDWGSGSGKSLTINQVTSILNDIKMTGDWKHAFRHVPRRKLVSLFDQPATNKLYKNVQNLYNSKHTGFKYNREPREKILIVLNIPIEYSTEIDINNC